ncbi:App1 family protein [Sphingomonas crocodyli]|uniref:DUF2183 domain-containing protein n=1 Tax=Sphingomonas crocodyli TaxID=1979270 RepID=A0A437LYF1_9SPHN|nr:phosphatase domain-containing protein [Sphingomonas crocodyli]RVT90441.1 DUF2183 domain-containing protein [Sphingomonas crocodyli]
MQIIFLDRPWGACGTGFRRSGQGHELTGSASVVIDLSRSGREKQSKALRPPRSLGSATTGLLTRLTPMSIVSGLLHAAALSLEGIIDGVTRRLPVRAEPRVRMLAYAGFRNARELSVSGRIVRFAEPLDPDEGFLARLRAMLAIYISHELADVPVRLDHSAGRYDTLSDDEGYFHFSIPINEALPAVTRWEAVTLTTPDHVMQAPSVDVPVLAPGTDDHWGVISDIDDTIIETGATNFFRNWRRVLVDRPQDRLAVPGAASLYGLIAGQHRSPTRPFFYVSSSPWNLYGFLADFMMRNAIPHGPMFLKDIGVDTSKFITTGHVAHKLGAIRKILAFYPDHRFLLMGDNGQKDVEIYAQVVRDYPERIGAVLIRDVFGVCDKGAVAEQLTAIRSIGLPVYCARDFEQATTILTALGFERPAEVARAGAEAAL